MIKMVKRERICEDESKVSKVKVSKDGTRLIPDEVLVSILCSLSFKEATATSLVGRRWRYLHRWTRKLDLDGTESLCNLIRCGRREIPLMMRVGFKEEYKEVRCNLIMRVGFKEEYKEARCKYIRWVESAVANHKSSSLEEFRVLYDLDGSHTDLIDSWLRFAVSRKVEKLELNLTAYSRPYDKPYTFPYKNVSEFRFIRKLCTNFVSVSGEVVVSFLRNCPLLEHLSVSRSLDLTYLEIINTFPSFKRLEINLCFNLESVVIRDSSLVILKMSLGVWPKIKQIYQFVVRNVPLLTEIWTSDMSLHMFSTVLPQIEMLKLYTTYTTKEDREDFEGGEFLSLGVEMSNLKQFVVVDEWQNHKHSLLPLINFIKASHGLHGLQRFVLEAPLYDDESNASKENIPIPLPIPRKKEIGIGGAMTTTTYPCLKEVKLVVNGYVSRQFEVVMHFVESGVALKNIVVDPRGVKQHMPGFGCRWDLIHQTKINTKILEMARALQSILPSTINVIIL